MTGLDAGYDLRGMRARLLVFLGAMLAALSAPSAPGPFAERDVFVRMRDGVRLEADILRPEKTGRFPTLGAFERRTKQAGGVLHDRC